MSNWIMNWLKTISGTLMGVLMITNMSDDWYYSIPSGVLIFRTPLRFDLLTNEFLTWINSCADIKFCLKLVILWSSSSLSYACYFTNKVIPYHCSSNYCWSSRSAIIPFAPFIWISELALKNKLFTETGDSNYDKIVIVMILKRNSYERNCRCANLCFYHEIQFCWVYQKRN